LREAEKDLVVLAVNVRAELSKGQAQWEGVPEIIDRRVAAIRAALAKAERREP
jgi:hypothetical protein